MKSPYIRFAVYVLCFTAMLAGLQLFTGEKLPPAYRLNSFYLLGIVAATVTAVHFFLLKSAGKSAQEFIRMYMLTTALKLFFYILLLMFVGLLARGTSPQALVLHFTVYYVVFTVLEVSQLYSIVTNNKK